MSPKWKAIIDAMKMLDGPETGAPNHVILAARQAAETASASADARPGPRGNSHWRPAAARLPVTAIRVASAHARPRVRR